MPKPSTATEGIRTKHPEIFQAFSKLAQVCHNAGPLEDSQIAQFAKELMLSPTS